MYHPNYGNQPETLITGKHYRLRSENLQTDDEQVTFLSYTSSPEMVIVVIQSEKINRVERSRLYERCEEHKT